MGMKPVMGSTLMNGIEPSERAEIEQWARRHGPSNCWTGTGGTAGRYILRLLEVIDEYERRLSEVSREQEPTSNTTRV